MIHSSLELLMDIVRFGLIHIVGRLTTLKRVYKGEVSTPL